tara:strand:+ start:166 stop:1098 length:933 start_codon:yes stop_codon:yes gene_type:complete
MKKIKIFIIFFILFNFNINTNGDSINIKAQVYNEIITNIDIENEKKYLFFLNPKLKELEEIRVNNLAKNSLITEIIKKKELEKFFNFSKEDNVIKILEENLLKRKNIRNKEEFIKILNDLDIDYQIIKKKLQIETFWNRLIYDKYANSIIINKQDLERNIVDQFNNKKEKFVYNLSEITFSVNVTESVEEKLSKINNSILNIGFENTANIYSISNTSNNGGLIGWVNELQISDQINKNINELAINQISKPIKIPSGFILIKVNDKKVFKQKINIEEELKKLINAERNRQLNSFSIIFYKRLKRNIEINEY